MHAFSFPLSESHRQRAGPKRPFYHYIRHSLWHRAGIPSAYLIHRSALPACQTYLNLVHSCWFMGHYEPCQFNTAWPANWITSRQGCLLDAGHVCICITCAVGFTSALCVGIDTQNCSGCSNAFSASAFMFHVR